MEPIYYTNHLEILLKLFPDRPWCWDGYQTILILRGI